MTHTQPCFRAIDFKERSRCHTSQRRGYVAPGSVFLGYLLVVAVEEGLGTVTR